MVRPGEKLKRSKYSEYYIIMQTISLPFIDLQRHYPAIMALYDAKAAEYNAKVAIARDSGDYSRQFLKSAHREVWQDLIRATKGEFGKLLFIFREKETQHLIARKPSDTVILMTNRKRLSNRTKKSEVTIYRLLERLIDSGIIEQKIHHGTQRDFELHLNRDLVPISDHKNERFDALLEIFQNTVDSTIQETLRSICTPCSSIKNSFNNKIITANIQEHEVESAPLILSIEQSGTFIRNTGDPSPAIAPVAAPEIAKINTFKNNSVITNAFGVQVEQNTTAKINTSDKTDDYAKKMEDARSKHQARIREYSIMLVEFVISVLFVNKTIYKSEREKAYATAEYYFKDFSSAMDCERALRNYRERVRLVQRFLERNTDFDFSNIYPARYLDPENTSSGFIMTSNWLKKHREFKELQQKTRTLKTEEAIIMYAVKRMVKWKNPSSYNYWRKYVSDKIPQRIEDYERIALNALKQK